MLVLILNYTNKFDDAGLNNYEEMLIRYGTDMCSKYIIIHKIHSNLDLKWAK